MTDTKLAILGPDGKPWEQEQRATTFRDPADWLEEWALGQSTASGERVNEQIAMSLSAWFAAIRNISEDVAKLDLILYSRRADGGKDRASAHPLHHLLHDSPNEEMGKLTFWQTILQHALGWSNGYAEIQRNGAGTAVALWPLDPSTVFPRRTKAGKLFYEIRMVDASFMLDPMDIFHVHGIGAMGQGGYNLTQIAREALGSYIALQKFGGSFFAGGATLGAILTHPNNLSDTALKHLRTSWAERHGSAGDAHKVAILEEGMTYTQLGVDPEKSQAIEQMMFHVEDVARWFRIPPHKLQHLARATWANIESLSIEYAQDTLLPWTKRVEQEISRKLLPIGGNLFAEHLLESALRADVATRTTAYTAAVAGGWMSRNEVRIRENMNPEPGLDFEDEPVEPEPDEPDESDDDTFRSDYDIFSVLADAHRPLLEDRFRSIIRHENTRVKQKGTGNGVFSEHQIWIRASLDTAVEAFCCSVWGAVRRSKMPDAAKNKVAAATTAISVRHMGKVEARMDNWKPWELVDATELASNEMTTLIDIMLELTNGN